MNADITHIARSHDMRWTLWSDGQHSCVCSTKRHRLMTKNVNRAQLHSADSPRKSGKYPCECAGKISAEEWFWGSRRARRLQGASMYDKTDVSLLPSPSQSHQISIKSLSKCPHPYRRGERTYSVESSKLRVVSYVACRHGSMTW